MIKANELRIGNFVEWNKGLFKCCQIFNNSVILNKRIMKNWKCKIGVHDYETIGSQNTQGVVGGFSMTPIMREVKKCKRCGKVHFIGYDIATNAHLDETLNWQPKLNY